MKHNENSNLAKIQANAYSTDVIVRIERELNSIIHLSSAIEAYVKINHENIDSTEIQKILNELVNSSSIIRNIGLAESTTIKYISPIEGNEEALGINYKMIPGQWSAVKKSIESKKGTIAGPIDLVQGGVAIIYRKPIYFGDTYWGILSTVIDIPKLCASTFEDIEIDKYPIAIKSTQEKGGIIYGSEDLFFKESIISTTAKLPNDDWIIVTDLDAHLADFETKSGSLNLIYLFVLFNFIIAVIIARLWSIGLLNNRQFHLLSKNTSDIVWVYDNQRKLFLFVSPNVQQEFGISSEQVVDGQFDILQDINFNSKQQNEWEYQVEDVNGKKIWVESTVKQVNSSKKEHEWLGITRIIEKRKQVEQKLINSEAQLKSIINGTFAGICIISPTGEYLFANPNTENILGFSFQELKEINYFEQIDNSEKTLAKSNVHKLLSETQDFVARDAHIKCKDGTYKWIELNSIKIPSLEDKNKSNILIVFQDISHHKANQVKLEEAIQTKDRYISILAHDLKSPFNAILGLLTLLKEKLGDNCDKEEVLHLTDILMASSTETYNLLENLLDWARVRQNEIYVKSEILNLYKLVNESLDAVQAQIANKKIECKVAINADMYVKVDKEMTKTIIRNLVSNAIKFSPIYGSINIVAESAENQIKIRIIDHGVGIHQKELDSIFNLDKMKSKLGTKGEKGTGFGLSICKDFAEKNGGTIHLESEFGLGTTAVLSLPIYQ
jgi:PAS domain S-box-containing protein